MTFDREAAADFLDSDDRDIARWFAGRSDETARIERAIRQSRGVPQTRFRIIQGAPGAGKTSLLHHLNKTAAPNRLHVRLDQEDLLSNEALDACINQSLRGRDPVWAKAAGRTVRAGDVADAEIEATRRSLSRNFELILVLDEGQAIQDDTHRVLLSLHTKGIGRPCVLLIAGLSHTADTIGAVKGISRLADNAVINLTRLSDAECADSTQQMLVAFGATGDFDHAGRKMADLSFGWPQHLFGAQQALARALIGIDGDLGAVDWTRVREESDHRRFDYYRKRLSSSALLKDVGYTAALVSAIGNVNEPLTESNLIVVCDAAMKRFEPPPIFMDDGLPTPTEMVREMIEKGVWAMVDDEHYEIAIPSMATWLEDQLPDQVGGDSRPLTRQRSPLRRSG